MDKAISNKKEVFTINCHEIPETIYVETRFISLAAAKQKKYDQLFYLVNKNGQLELTHNKTTFLALKNCNKIPKPTVSVSLPSLQAPSVVQKAPIVQQSNIASTISTLPSQQLIRPIPIAKLSNNVIKTNPILNAVSLPRVNAIPISTAAEISVVNIPRNVTKSLEPTAIINSKRSFNDNMQQTEISAFNMKSVGIQCQLADEDLETDWSTTVQEEPSDSAEIDNIEMAKENFLKFVQENSTQYRNSLKECLICGEVCKSNKYFYTHMAIHQGPKVLCFKCGFCFENDDLLRKHNCLRTKLSHQNHLKCPHYRCRVTAISKLELYDHLNEHDNYRPYKCTGCRKDYFTRQEFLRHIFLRAKCYTQAKRKRYCIYNLQEQRDRLCRVRVFTLHTFKKRTILVTKYLSRRASNYGKCKICSRLYTNKRVFKSHHAKCAGIFRKRLMRKRYGIRTT